MAQVERHTQLKMFITEKCEEKIQHFEQAFLLHPTERL